MAPLDRRVAAEGSTDAAEPGGRSRDGWLASRAGGTYPDYVPAPYIVTSRRDDVDVVTTVTEAPSNTT